jgi:hypothetical protein
VCQVYICPYKQLKYINLKENLFTCRRRLQFVASASLISCEFLDCFG